MIDDSSLLHAEQPYDPQKAREYYLRTRKLKGRRRGSAVQNTSTRSSTASAAAKQKAKPKKTAAQKRKEVEIQVAALKKRLARLKEVLAELVKAAQKRSGVDKPDPKHKADSKSNAKDAKPQTAQQKREAAKRAKENYEKNKDKQTPEKELADLKKEIKAIRAKIQKALDDAKKQNARNPKSKTAPKRR
jgi:chromosome segregation ATPase